MDVPTRDLGDGVLMPMLGLGVWQAKAGTEARQAVEWALEAGYRHIDTATYYRNEADVGAAIAASGIPREEIFVTTKWLPVLRSPPSEIRRSLERLNMEYVDLYLIHWPVPRVTRARWSDFEDLREQGLARAIGVSNYGAERLTKLLDSAKVPPAVNQVQLSPFHYRKALLELCDRRGVVFEAYSSLERGRKLADTTIAGIAARVEREPAQVMLRWGIQHGAVQIPKSVRRDRIVSNAQIFDFELSAEEMATLDALDTTGGTGSA